MLDYKILVTSSIITNNGVSIDTETIAYENKSTALMAAKIINTQNAKEKTKLSYQCERSVTALCLFPLE